MTHDTFLHLYIGNRKVNTIFWKFQKTRKLGKLSKSNDLIEQFIILFIKNPLFRCFTILKSHILKVKIY